ncbi:MAG TPA: tyrosine-type recombinase/integrase [Candidatus Desulfaltia sp.]|nr:tyrosine-type recombinase/integrase [Candidatus Desulfaltia sp.]
MEKLLSVKEAAELLHCHPKTIYRNKALPCHNIPGIGIRYKPSELEKYVEQNTLKAVPIPSPRLSAKSPKLTRLDDFDRFELKGDSAVSKKRQRWNYGKKGVYRRKSKTGESWCYWYYEAKGKIKKVTVRGAVSREDAIHAMEAKVREVFNREHGIKKKEISLGDFAVEYLEKYAKLRKRSWKSDEKFLSSQLIPFFGSKLLSAITSQHVSEFIIKRRSEGVKNSTIHKHLQVLRRMFNLAEDFGYEAGKNPVRPYHFSSEEAYRRTRVLSDEEEPRLMQEAAPHLKAIMRMAVETGMRKQEILKLKIEDVDFSQEVIRIRPENNKAGKLDIIPLPHSMKELIKKLIEENAGRTVYVFNYYDSRTGKLRPVESIEHAFQAACRRAKIKDLQFRDLRRTYGTRLHEKGVDPLIIQRLLRHSSFRISEQVYIQSSMKMMKEAVNGTGKKTKDETIPEKLEQNWNNEGLEKAGILVSPWLSRN